MDCMIHIHNFIVDWNLQRNSQDFIDVSEDDMLEQEQEQLEFNPIAEVVDEDEDQIPVNDNSGTEGLDRLMDFFTAENHLKLRTALVEETASTLTENLS